MKVVMFITFALTVASIVMLVCHAYYTNKAIEGIVLRELPTIQKDSEDIGKLVNELADGYGEMVSNINNLVKRLSQVESSSPNIAEALDNTIDSFNNAMREVGKIRDYTYTVTTDVVNRIGKIESELNA